MEKYLAASDLRWSVVAPVYFMSNLFFPDTFDGLKKGTYAIALPGGTPLQKIAMEDLGAFVAHVLANPDEFAGWRIDIASDELSSQESTEVLAGVLGKPVSLMELPVDAIRSFSEDFALMYEWFASTGYVADIDGLRSTYPEGGVDPLRGLGHPSTGSTRLISSRATDEQRGRGRSLSPFFR